MKKRKIAIIGHFGGNKEFLDGQTVKTKTLYEELAKTDEYIIYKVDTYYKSHNPFKLIWQTLNVLFFYKDIFVLLSGGGMRMFFPLLYIASRLKNARIYHDVIGGNLDIYVKNNKKYIKYLNSFKVNLVEIGSLKLKLEKEGITNAEVLPNFKSLQNISANDYKGEIFRFCTFSRVMREKGIEIAIEAINQINKENGKTICTLDIYGPVDNGYIENFELLKKGFNKEIKYCGLVPFGDSVNVLKDYYALLFPTFWDGEGFPGTILDAYASAVPVIATDWNYNRELVRHAVTGIIYPEGDIKTFYEAVDWAISNRDKMNIMRKNCSEEYLKYTPQAAMKIIKKHLNN